jgi:phage gpG-like protein
MDNKFPLEEMNAHFKQVLNKAPAALGIDAVNFFLDSFRQQAWRGATREQWPARKATRWGKKSSRGKAILIQSDRLKRSIRVTSSSATQVTIGSDVPYARAHNEGFKGTVNQTVRPFTRKNGSNVKGFSRTINQNIPRRQFMGNSPVLTAQLMRTLNEKLLKGLPNS